ncbi:MAG: arginine--tRNA ligase [Chloroflexi bacterium]|nr:arginine--tRNA ligase [Chloroflexota bacterium]
MLISHEIDARVRAAVEEAQRRDLLPTVAPPDVVVERPQKPEHGDFATSLPMRLARAARMKPLEIAERLVSLMPGDDVFERVWAAPPGFINFVLHPRWLGRQVDEVRRAGEGYGNLDVGAGTRVQVEYVSVNPTGPIHVGHARGAVLGSALAEVLAAAGYDVTREYYVNDAGSQMDAFYKSLYARYAQALGQDVPLPPEGYQGQYMVELGQELARELGDRFLAMPQEQAVRETGEIGLGRMLECIQQDLEMIGVRFDVWFRERSLYQSGQYNKAMGLLRQGGHTAEREGALWFTSTALGEDKDNVLVRSSGLPTYFASDVAYHYNKFVERGLQRVINLWGADHQGHVPRMKAVVGALGIDPSRLHIIIVQMVSLRRGDEVVKVSKRTGELITLRELVEEVGPDACRFFFLARSPESQMDFDMELATKQSADNPVYYVQYAHARIAGILRLARERGIDWSDGDVSLLAHEAELALVRKMVLLPELVESITRTLEPHSLPHYALELATAFHWFYQQCRVVSSVPEDAAITKARLKLTEGARVVLARTLHLMGVNAPDRM